MVTIKWLALAGVALLMQAPAHALNARYAQQLERSGCTQASELQGCDIHKSKAENAKAGFGAMAPDKPAPAAQAVQDASPYTGQWVARSEAGATVATIRIDAKNQTWVNGKRVKAKKSDGALVFHVGPVTYTIQGDRRLQGEDTWIDRDAGTKGLIHAQ
jgi:hypothetical protein